ncbi:1-deoxy-D-xylulose-5-phosphate synthase [Planctomycetales bacterium 10988]|nr:1-deoxy-D-xylulose-5-phosphate synthase [Planctomycetales bacterium 10988]
MEGLLARVDSPADLQGLSLDQLNQLAAEVREALCQVVQERPAHFASNLGVVELCIALHKVFDFRRDRLIWDTGHQIYPHKLITGRRDQFHTIRTKGGLMGYPNPKESIYDLFVTGHAGCSVSATLGLRAGDDLLGESDRHAVAVIGDGAFPSGIVYEALNNASGLNKRLIVILNDNKMSICPRVGGVAQYLDRLRLNPWYDGLKSEVQKILHQMPQFIGQPTEKFLSQVKESVKAGLHGGMLFEELGFSYIGPIDGHDIGSLCSYLDKVKEVETPVLLHIVTEKGHGFQPAEEDPVFFHTPAPFERCKEDDNKVVSIKKSSSQAYTHIASDAILEQMRNNPKVTVLTAAMCQGNNLSKIRDTFPERFFDTGICESHTVAFAAGMAKAGIRPIVDIYSTFLQRSFDQIFQEVALQNLPVTFMLDRAGLTGPDGPTHHGVFDVGYMRMFPNMVVMAPGDAADLSQMLEFSLQHDTACSIRYPKAKAVEHSRSVSPLELGKAEVFEWGTDGMIVACGTLLDECLKAAELLREEGLDVGVINARFIKPLDETVLLRALDECGFVLTVEEAALMTGFGSAVLEMANAAGKSTRTICRMGLPDQFVEHGERGELLHDLGLDAEGIASRAREFAQSLTLYEDAGASE